MAGGIRTKDVTKSYDDVTNDDKDKMYGSYDMKLEPEHSLISEKDKIK